MNPAYEPWLAPAGAQFEGDTLLGFSDPAQELSLAQSASVVIPLPHLALLRATGEEAAAFLHNQLTNDVKGLGENSARLNGLCTAKGRLIASFLMWHEGNDFLLQLSADIAPAVLKKLSMYVLRSKVKLSDASNERCQFGLSGPRAADALAALGMELPGGTLAATHSAANSVIRLGESRFMLSVPAAAAGEIFAALSASGLAPAGTAAWQWLDIQAGWPLVTASTQEEFVPQMANFELLGGVSFKKGCYPGQEIVARTQYLGKLKKRMYHASVTANGLPAAGTDLYSPDLGEQSCGKVVTATPSPEGGYELLAVMQMSSHEGNDVHLGSPGGPQLAFRSLPYAVD